MRTSVRSIQQGEKIMATVSRASVTGEIVSYGLVVASTPLLPSSTLGAGWQNPENVPIAAKVVIDFTTAGTGTIDVGLGTGGTGAAAQQYINGGTMAVGLINPVNFVGSLGVLGGNAWVKVGANGDATDSIVVVGNEAATGTYAGNLYVHYHILES